MLGCEGVALVFLEPQGLIVILWAFLPHGVSGLGVKGDGKETVSVYL